MMCFFLRKSRAQPVGALFLQMFISFILIFNVCDSNVYASDGFTGGVTPSRFELNSEPGKTIRRSIDIYNLGSRPATYRVRTVDWDYSEKGNVSFFDELLDNSCRPWVRIEQHEVEIMPTAQIPRNFRFEIHIPEDAPKYECRFALMIEGKDNELVTQLGRAKNIALPINGRIAVIVYLGVDGVEPDLAVNRIFIDKEKGDGLPAIEVENLGDAHGRLESDVTAKTAQGKKLQLTLASSPILAGQKRALLLKPVGNVASLDYPLIIRGNLYSDRHTFKIDTVLHR